MLPVQPVTVVLNLAISRGARTLHVQARRETVARLSNGRLDGSLNGQRNALTFKIIGHF